MPLPVVEDEARRRDGWVARIRARHVRKPNRRLPCVLFSFKFSFELGQCDVKHTDGTTSRLFSPLHLASLLVYPPL